MIFPKTLLLALAGSVLALPTDSSVGVEAIEKRSPNVPSIEKRAGEVIFLVNCQTYDSIFYFADSSQANHFPSSGGECDHKIVIGSPTSCTFDTGVTFSYTLSSNAGNLPAGSFAGTGSNGFHSYTCHRGDNHVIATDGNGHQCRDVFACTVSPTFPHPPFFTDDAVTIPSHD